MLEQQNTDIQERAESVTDKESVTGVSGERLQAYLQRIERLEEERKGMADDIKEIYAEAKATGFDVKTMRTLVKLRKMDTEKRREQEELLALYQAAIGLD